MTRDPRAPWTVEDFPQIEYLDAAERREGANDRLAALLPQLEAADALAHAVGGCGGDWQIVWPAIDAFLAARDAHLTEGTGP